MHVALLTDADVFAGTERHILDLAAALRQLPDAPEVCIACPQPSPLAERAQKAGIPIVPVASSATGVLHWPTVFQLRDILRKGQVEILHAHNGRMALHAALAKFLARRGALVTTQHFLTPSHATQTGIKAKVFNAAHHWVGAQAAHCIAISSAVENAMKSRGEAVSSKTSTVLNGLPDMAQTPLRTVQDVRAEFSLDGMTPLIVCAARLEKEKSVETLIEAMTLLHRENIAANCLIAGEGDEKMLLQLQLERANVNHCVRLLGFRSDVLSLMHAADVFVLPSLAEPFGLVLLEAMTLSRPIVATNAGGPPEIVEHDVTGILVPPADAPALAAALRTLIENRDQCSAMGNAGRKRYEAQFRVEQMAHGIREIYRKVRPRRSA